MKDNKSAVGRSLGIDYRTLLLRLKRYRLSGHEFETSLVMHALHRSGRHSRVVRTLAA